MTLSPSGLTPKQLAVLTFIRGYIAEHGYSPNLREIGKGIGCNSTGNVHRYLTALEQRGHLARRANSSRSIILLHEPRPSSYAALVRAGLRAPNHLEELGWSPPCD